MSDIPFAELATGMVYPLHYAIRTGQPTEALIASCDLNAKDNLGMTPFMVAAIHNHEVAMRLLGLGVDVDAKDPRGKTALELAIEHNHPFTSLQTACIQQPFAAMCMFSERAQARVDEHTRRVAMLRQSMHTLSNEVDVWKRLWKRIKPM